MQVNSSIIWEFVWWQATQVSLNVINQKTLCVFSFIRIHTYERTKGLCEHMRLFSKRRRVWCISLVGSLYVLVFIIISSLAEHYYVESHYEQRSIRYFFRRIFSLYVSLLFILFLFSSLHDLHRESKSVSYIYTLSESMFFCTSYNTCIYHIQSFFFVSCKWNYFTHSSLSSSFSFLAIRKKKRNILSFSTIHTFCCIYFFLSKENCFINRSCFFFLYWFSHSNSTLTKTRWEQQQKNIW